MQVVLDASAQLAYLRAEPGSDGVDGLLGVAEIPGDRSGGGGPARGS